MTYIFEVAKNGEYTCKYNDGLQNKYIYSKYNPSNIRYNWELQTDVDGYILLGIGLGYEYLKSKTNKPIYVIELNDLFKSFISKNTNLNPIYIEQVFPNYQILINESIYEFEKSAYDNLLQSFIDHEKKKVYMLAYNVIAKDCKETFESLNYEVQWMTTNDFEEWIKNIQEIPDYFFSINYQPWLGELAEQLKVPYISWTVDTPSYSLFLKNNIDKQYSYTFHYDAVVARKLKNKGLKKAYYLPVAANTKRLANVCLKMDSLEVSFLGNSCGHNEYRTHIQKFLSREETQLIDTIISDQMKSEGFIIEERLPSELINKIINIPGIIFPDGLRDILSDREIVSLLIGRQHSYIERTNLVKYLEGYYDFKVYGDKYWETINSSSYAGHAEHYLEMPAVFKNSKINLNIIRSFVDSGLPMRVFDVLGSGGFLLTNAKEDIYKYFKDGEHLVIFNSLEELKDKIEYYLEHEEDRKKIALNGLSLIEKYHTFEIRIKRMMDILAEEGV